MLEMFIPTNEITCTHPVRVDLGTLLIELAEAAPVVKPRRFVLFFLNYFTESLKSCIRWQNPALFTELEQGNRPIKRIADESEFEGSANKIGTQQPKFYQKGNGKMSVSVQVRGGIFTNVFQIYDFDSTLERQGTPNRCATRLWNPDKNSASKFTNYSYH